MEAMKSRDPERMVCDVPAAPERDAIGRRIRPKKTDFSFKGLDVTFDNFDRGEARKILRANGIFSTPCSNEDCFGRDGRL